MVPIQDAFATIRLFALKPDEQQHKDYRRTVDLAKDYKAFITGKDMDHLYVQYDPRENKKDLEQSIRLTNPLTPSICAALSTPLRKLVNVSPKTYMITYNEDAESKKSQALRNKLDSIYADNDLTALFGKRFLDAGLEDPNAFVVWSFEGDGAPTDRTVLTRVIPSKDVWGFDYKGDVLQWLMIREDIHYAAKRGDTVKLVEGVRFTIYTGDHHIVFEQVAHDTIGGADGKLYSTDQAEVVDVSNPPFASEIPFYFRVSANTLYSVRFYAQKSGRVPAFRLGFKRDAYTDGRTCVNFWHAAYWHLRRLIKLGRENDLSFVLHCFLQKFSYETPCTAKDCNGGYMPNDDKCGRCGGTGWAKTTHTTASDHITLSLPKNRAAADLFDLSKLTHYVSIPTEILGIQNAKIESEVKACFRAVFTSDVYVSDTTASTATEKRIDMQSVYDSITDAVSWWNNSHMDSAYIVGSYIGQQEGLSVIYRLPRDLGFESGEDILRKLKEATAIPGTIAYRLNLIRDLNNYEFQDDPLQLARVQTMTKFDPFAGKSDETVMTIFGLGTTTMFNKVLWSNYEEVFDLAEEKAISNGNVLYSLSRKEQRNIIKLIVEEMLERLDTTSAAPIGDLGVIPDEDTPDDVTRTADEDATEVDNRSIQGPFEGDRGGRFWLVDGQRVYDDPRA